MKSPKHRPPTERVSSTRQHRHSHTETLIVNKPSPEMETKKLTAAVLFTLLLPMPFGQQQQQKLPPLPFCDCYRQCHPWCSNSTPWWLCNVGCAGSCAISCCSGDRYDILAACTMVCSTDIVCGYMAAPADEDGVGDCVRECNKRWGHN